MFQPFAKLFTAPSDPSAPTLKVRLAVDGMEDRVVPAVAAGVTVAAVAEYFTPVGPTEAAQPAAIKGAAQRFLPAKDLPAVQKFSPVKMSPAVAQDAHGLIIAGG